MAPSQDPVRAPAPYLEGLPPPSPRSGAGPRSWNGPVVYANVGGRIGAELLNLLLVTLPVLAVPLVFAISESLLAGVVTYLVVATIASVLGVVFAIMDGRRGQTPGRKAVGHVLVDQYTRGPIGAWRALGRRIVLGILNSMIVPSIASVIMAATDPEGRTIHDRLFGTRVLVGTGFSTAPLPPALPNDWTPR